MYVPTPLVSLPDMVFGQQAGTLFILQPHWNVGTSLCCAVWKRGTGALTALLPKTSLSCHGSCRISRYRGQGFYVYYPRVGWAMAMAAKPKRLKEEVESCCNEN